MSCELFVGNLNPEIRIRDLENCFGRYGKIVRCDLKKNFGFIQFEDKRDAEEAIRKENDRNLLGSVMTVEWAKGSIGDKGIPRLNGSFRRPPPSRFGGRPGMRDRSPFGGGRSGLRDRSPIGRGPMQRSNGFSPRNDKFGGAGPGGRRYSGGRDDFDSPRFNRGDRFAPRDNRFNSNDRGPNRGPPPRSPINSFDRPDRFNDRRPSFGERRNFGGPRRF